MNIKMLQLCAPQVTIPKDAARAVKRVSQLDIKAVTSESLTKILDLPGMQVTHYAVESTGENKYLHLFCTHQHDIAICSRCLRAQVTGYDSKDRCVRHVDILGMKTLIYFQQRRFDSEVCGIPFSENLSWIAHRCRQKLAFEEYIYQRVKKTQRRHVALEAELSESTVPGIFKKWANAFLRPHTRQNLKVLGGDDISLRKGYKQYALVLSDLERRCAPGWFLKVIEQFPTTRLLAQAKPEELAKILYVT